MGRFIDLTGQKFGRLTVVSFHFEGAKSGGAQWNCDCDCGAVKTVRGNHLRSGAAKSCGCLSREMSSARGLEIAPSNRRAWALRRRVDGLSIRRIAKGLSIQEAAARIGILPASLSQVECGRRKFGFKCNIREIRAIYGDLAKFGKKWRSKSKYCLVCNSIFCGQGKADRRRQSPTRGKTFDICCSECLKRWYAGERFKAPLPTPLMGAPAPPKERKRDREKAAIAEVVRENIARKTD